MSLIQIAVQLAEYHYEVTGVLGAILSGVFLLLGLIWMIIMWCAVMVIFAITFGWPFLLLALVIWIIVKLVKR
jgi:hypothetical protein